MQAANAQLASVHAAGMRSASGLKVAAGLMAGAGAVVAVGLASSVKAAMSFEKQLSSLSAVSGANAQEMKLLGAQALKAGADTAFSAREAAVAQTELAKGGLTVANIMSGGLNAALALAAAGELELGDAAAITANTMNLFGLQGREAASVADALATAANATTADVADFGMAMKAGGSVAKSAGLNFRQTTVILEALAASGIKNSDAGTSMKAALIQLIKPTDKQAAVAKELGLSWLDSSGRMKDASSISAMLRGRLDGMTAAQRTATLATLAGTDGVRTLTALYDAGPAKLDAWSRGLGKAGTAAAVAREKQNNLAGAIEQLKGSWETLQIIVGTKLIPVLTVATRWLTGLLNEMQTGQGAGGMIADAFGRVAAAAGGMISVVGQVVGFFREHTTTAHATAAALSVLVAGFVALRVAAGIQALIYGVVTAFWALNAAIAANPVVLAIVALAALAAAFVVAYEKCGWFRDAVNDAWTAIKTVAGPVIDWLVGAVGDAWAWIKQASIDVWAVVGGTVTTVLQAVWRAISTYYTAYWQVIQTVWNAVRDATVAAWPIVSQVVGTHLKVVWTVVSTIVRAVYTVLHAQWTAVKAVTQAVWPIVSAVVGTQLRAAWTVVKTVAVAVVAQLILAWAAVKAVTTTVWPVIRTVVGAAITAVRAIVGTQVAAALAVLRAAWSAIRAVTTTVWAAVRAVVGAAVSAVSAVIRSVIAPIVGFLAGVWARVRSGVVSAWNSIRGAITGAVNTAISTIRGLIPGFVTVGAQMVAGVVRGILAKAGDIAAAAAKVVTGAISAAKSKLGIKSPSKVFEQIGRYVGEGFVRGLTGSTTQISQAVERFVNAATKAARAKGATSSQKTALSHLIDLAEKDRKRLQTLARDYGRVGEQLKARKDDLAALLRAKDDMTASVSAGLTGTAGVTGAFTDTVNAAGEKTGSVTSGAAIVASLAAQLAATETLRTNLAQLAAMGLNSGALQQIASAGLEVGGATAAALIAEGGASIAAINDLQAKLTTAADAIGVTVASSMYDAGIAAAVGLVEGLKSQQAAIDKQMDRIARSLVRAIRRALKIRSPSAVFHDIGVMTAKGMELGIAQGAAGVHGALAGLTQTPAQPRLSLAGQTAGTTRTNARQPAPPMDAASIRDLAAAMHRLADKAVVIDRIADTVNDRVGQHGARRAASANPANHRAIY